MVEINALFTSLEERYSVLYASDETKVNKVLHTTASSHHARHQPVGLYTWTVSRAFIVLSARSAFGTGAQ